MSDAGSIHEDPNLLRLNAMIHRMERNRCLTDARRARKWVWLVGSRRYRLHVSQAYEHQSLAKWFQHMAERFVGDEDQAIDAARHVPV